ncbi:LOW QUALITY PROTEIN: phenoloxidase-activating factor 2 [Drosophila eugracilis]|uniref:LOW QUALITY PROTEIN: phenoloxidase-activating factor 2 n=1 Tax=Drosophila eugracilis TaxID=29029 RepID=UPI001BDAB96C|nr:LOW QUALITY PROTEIN: phenoloxidase-activating factor 2 [Drosophila eugracilis]
MGLAAIWLHRIVLIYFLGFQLPSISSFKNCGPEKQCVPYEQCNEGLMVDGKFYPDRSRTTLDENCHYMEKCCNIHDTLLTPGYQQEATNWPCGGRHDLWYYLRPLGYKQQEAKFGEFPWLVAIYGAGDYLCSGALITPLAVITAAHCVQNVETEKLLLVAGEWDAAVELEPQPHQARLAVESLLHPNFTQMPLANNMAIIIVDKKTPFLLAPNVQPICLPPPEMKYNYSQCYISGWQRGDFVGSTILPKRWTLYVLPPDQCRVKLRLSFLGRRHTHNDSLLCAGGDKGDFVCDDVEMTGVPLMCPISGHDDRFLLAGLLTRTARCDGPQLLGIYTNVKLHRQWIDLKLRERELDIRQYMV